MVTFLHLAGIAFQGGAFEGISDDTLSTIQVGWIEQNMRGLEFPMVCMK